MIQPFPTLGVEYPRGSSRAILAPPPGGLFQQPATRQHQCNREGDERHRQQGTDVTRIDLPKIGARGNSHMLMMDTNSDQIAAMIQKWMVDKGLSQ